MRFTFLGTSGFHPSSARHTTGLAVPELGVLFDAGSGSFRVPEVFAIEPGDEKPLDIYLTHAHLDHIIGLTFFVAWQAQNRFGAIRVFAQQHVHDAIDEHLFSEHLFPVQLDYERVIIDVGKPLPLRDGSTLTTRVQDHRGVSLGYRLDTADGRALAFCTDAIARPNDQSAIEFVRDVDVLIHECHFDDADAHLDEPTGHSSMSNVCQIAVAAGVSRVVLTHINPYYDPSRPLDVEAAHTKFPSLDLTVATDFMHVDL